MKIAGIEVGRGSPPRVVAEIGCNHNGSLELAKKLVRGSVGAGADFIKFQAYIPQELVKLRGDGPAPEPWAGRTMAELYAEAQTPLKWFPELSALCAELDVPWFSSVFGLGSLAFLEAVDCPAYKLAASDFGKRSLRHMVEATGKPVIRSVPEPRNPGKKWLTLYCPPGYPQEPTSLKCLKHFGGFSYHGNDPFVPALAASLGASMIEVHVQADDEKSKLDAHSSLTVSQLDELVGMISVASQWQS